MACAVSEHRSKAPVESCGVVCCTPQALLLFLESWDSVLCQGITPEPLSLFCESPTVFVSFSLCLLSSVYILQWIGNFPPSPIVVVACAVSEHRSRAPVESCGVVYCTPQALSLFLESCGSCVTLHKLCHCFLSHGTLCCVSHCVCVLSSLSIVLLCIYTAVDWELSPQSHSLHCRLVALLFCP